MEGPSTRACAVLSGVFVVVLVLGTAGPTAAQGCLSMHPELIFDTSDNCSSEPDIDRIFGGEVIRWKNHWYLFGNIGNELRIWNIDDPDDPQHLVDSEFDVPYVGDSDYDLKNFSICGTCRYGIASFKGGTVLFDLGSGSQPDFVDHELYGDAHGVEGAFTFDYDGQQYLIASRLPDECATGDASLYKLKGVDEDGLDLQSCVQADGEAPTEVFGGFHVPGVPNHYLYLGDRSQDVHLFRIVEVGSTVYLEWVSTPMLANMLQRGKGMAVDLDAGIAVTASSSGMKVWDISSPGSPMQRGSVGNISVNRAAVRFPFVWVARMGWVNSERTFDITDVTNPVALDQQFWDPLHPWNYPGHACAEPQGAVFSPDASTMYLARYSVGQMVDFVDCGPPSAPNAVVSVSPSPAFPGDQITVSDASTGVVDARALWITSTSDPYGSTPVAGSSTLSPSTPVTLTFDLPIDLQTGVSYWAHVAVSNADNPYYPSGHAQHNPDQIDSQLVIIDRAPDASIALVPDTPITGDTVDIIGSGEGHPSNPDGINPAYEWWITRPGQAQYQVWGQQLEGFDLDITGQYVFELTVYYEHTSGGGAYVAEEALELDISTVFASFEYSPTGSGRPRHNEDILLDGSSSNYQAGANVSFGWEVLFHVGGASAYAGCPDAATCTIPAETLDPGSYDFRLTLTNNDNGDVSVMTIEEVEVHDGTVQLDFTWSPDPARHGEPVEFRVEGVPGALDWAEWDFGGNGCPPFTQTVTCTPWITDCKAQAYMYADIGTKTVSLRVKLEEGDTYGPVSHNVSVVSGVGCGGGGGGGSGCTYIVSPLSVAYPYEGGVGVVTVATTAECSWTAGSHSPEWITITAGASGTGSGVVQFQVAENPGRPRMGWMTVADQAVTVSQAMRPVPVDFEASSFSPDIGEVVTFTADPLLEVASWDFGSVDCDGNDPLFDCTHLPTGYCNQIEWTYPLDGAFDVTMTVEGGESQTKTVTVQPNGECCGKDDEPDASFTMSPNPASTGDTVTFTDTSSGGGGSVNNDPEEWLWTVRLDGAIVVTSAEPEFDHVFTLEGIYEVKLVASNCRGSDTAIQYLRVNGNPIPDPEDFVVASAVRTRGYNDTWWKTDLRLFNPGDQPVSARVEYLSDNGNNAGGGNPFLVLILPGKGTEVYPDIVDAIPSASTGGNDKGSLRITFEYSLAGSMPPLIVSRTYNDTPEGTFGQFVPAIPVQTVDRGRFFLTGLVHDLYFRTNIGFANFGLEDEMVQVRVLDYSGQQIGTTLSRSVPALSVRRLDRVAEAAGIHTALNVFTVEINTDSDTMWVYASVIDNVTGDPVLLSDDYEPDDTVYIPGIAHLPGVNESQWRTDISLFNPQELPLSFVAEYFPCESQDWTAGLTSDSMETMVVAHFKDIVAYLVGSDVESKGHFVVKGLQASPVPQIVARSYNQVTVGQTYGQNLKVYGSHDLIAQNETGYIAGVAGSTDPTTGFRTNLGLLNTDEDGPATVDVLLFDESGVLVGEKRGMTLAPNEFRQSNLFQILNPPSGGGKRIDADMNGSVQITVRSGGAVAAYASVIDNRTQDPIFIPAQKVPTGR